MNKTIGTCAVLYLAVGAGALIVGAGLAVAFSFYDVPPELQVEALVAFGLVVVQVSAGFIGLLPEGIMFAHHEFVVRNLVRIAGVLLRLCLTVAALSLSPTLIALAAVQVSCLAFDFSVSWWLIHRRYPNVRISVADFDREVLRKIFSFSVWVLLLNAGARLIFETDALVIGAFMGVQAIPYYVVANSLIVYVMEFVIGIAAVVSPMATKLHTAGDIRQLREIFLRWSKVSLSLSAMAGLFLVVLGPTFIGQWLEPSFVGPSGQVLQILMISSFVFLPIRGVAMPILLGIGQPRVLTVALLGAGALKTALSVLLIGPLGLTGVALGTAIANVLFATGVLIVTCRALGLAPSSYVKYVVPRIALGSVPVVAFLIWSKRVFPIDSLTGLVAAGSAMMVVFAITWVFYVYRDDPYVDLRAHLGGRRVWGWSRA